ncbi:MAG: radical SAM protein [Oligoflexia bacterium]|nr:radical SAM protein [Oligoflexia bacterium]
MSLKSAPDNLELFGQQIFHWHLELSSKCALKCPRCPRTELPGRYKVTEMSLDFVKKIFAPERLLYVKKILMNGGQGDAIYCSDFIRIIKYLKSAKRDLQLCIITNGSYKEKEWWQETAQVLNKNDIIIFSIDGWDQESNEKYRVNSHFESIMEGIKTLRQFNSEIYIVWSAIIFKFNQDKIDHIKELAKSMGVDSFNVVQSRLFGSINPDYIDPNLGYDPLEPDKDFIESSNTNRGFYINFTKRFAGVTINPTIYKFIKEYEKDYEDSYISPLCRIGERGLYIDAEGILYPCSWISHPFKIQASKRRNKSIVWEKSLFVEHKDCFDLKKHSLEDVIQHPYWIKLQCSWLDSKKAFVECEKHCHQSASKRKINILMKKINNANHKKTLQAVKDYRREIES